MRVDRDTIVKRFDATTGWQALVVKHVGGAAPDLRYNIFKRCIMKRIAATAGGVSAS